MAAQPIVRLGRPGTSSLGRNLRCVSVPTPDQENWSGTLRLSVAHSLEMECSEGSISSTSRLASAFTKSGNFCDLISARDL